MSLDIKPVTQTLRENPIAFLADETTVVKSCRCNSNLHDDMVTFNVIVWDVTELDRDEPCPECHSLTDDFTIYKF